jgi:hypothetical protein
MENEKRIYLRFDKANADTRIVCLKDIKGIEIATVKRENQHRSYPALEIQCCNVLATLVFADIEHIKFCYAFVLMLLLGEIKPQQNFINVSTTVENNEMKKLLTAFIREHALFPVNESKGKILKFQRPAMPAQDVVEKEEQEQEQEKENGFQED